MKYLIIIIVLIILGIIGIGIFTLSPKAIKEPVLLGSPTPILVSYLKVPIIGSGTEKDPYRPDLPAGVNFSALIPTDKDGKPINTDAIVVIKNSDFIKIPPQKILKTLVDLKAELTTRGELQDFATNKPFGQ